MAASAMTLTLSAASTLYALVLSLASRVASLGPGSSTASSAAATPSAVHATTLAGCIRAKDRVGRSPCWNLAT